LQKTDSNPSIDKLTNLGTCHIKIRPTTKITIPLYSIISPTQQHEKIQEEKPITRSFYKRVSSSIPSKCQLYAL